jgi:hypothetical protein
MSSARSEGGIMVEFSPSPRTSKRPDAMYQAGFRVWSPSAKSSRTRTRYGLVSTAGGSTDVGCHIESKKGHRAGREFAVGLMSLSAWKVRIAPRLRGPSTPSGGPAS